MSPESPNSDRDYPQLVGDRGLIEPAPRRVRGYFDQALVFDTIRAHYVWEIAYYPQYYIPVSDVRMEHLQDENHVQKVQFGSSRLYSLSSPERTWPSAARVYDSGPVAGSVRFEWDALDWFEEDEPIILHPRNPYVRVDALRSHRHIRVALDVGVLDFAKRRRRVSGYRLGLRLPAARGRTHRRDDRFLQREARHLRRWRVDVSASHNLHVALRVGRCGLSPDRRVAVLRTKSATAVPISSGLSSWTKWPPVMV